MTKHFRKTFNIGHPKECWNYLKNHSTYYTMSSWNKLRSVANNVKLYNLPLRHDWTKVLEALEKDNWNIISTIIEGWEYDQGGCEVFFNGRSDGYLVIKNKKNNTNILPAYVTDYNTYEDMKKDYQVNEIVEDLRLNTELIRDFDKLCDYLIDVCDYLTEKYETAMNSKVEMQVKKLEESVTYEVEEKDVENVVAYMKDMGYNNNIVRPTLDGTKMVCEFTKVVEEKETLEYYSERGI